MIDLRESVLCDFCGNMGQGIEISGKQICSDCINGDRELRRIKDIVRFVMPELAARIETMISNGGIK